MEIVTYEGTLKIADGQDLTLCIAGESQLRYVEKKSLEKFMGFTGAAKNWLHDFLIQIQKYGLVPIHIIKAAENPRTLMRNDGEKFETYPIRTFFDFCSIISASKASGYLFLSEYRYAKQTDKFLSFVGTAKPEVVVDIATGFQLEKYNFKRLIAEEAFKRNIDLSLWVQALNDDYYQAIFQMIGCQWRTAAANVEDLLMLINNTIVLRLEEALFNELKTTKPKKTYLKFSAPVQHLEHTDLQKFVVSVTAFIVASDFNSTILNQLLNRVYPLQREANLYFPKPDQMAVLQSKPEVQHLQSDLEKILKVKKIKP